MKEGMMSRKHDRILIVDDEIETLDLVEKSVQGHGYEVFKSQSGPRALELLAQCSGEGSPIDLMVLDVMMPGMDGMQVLEKIRADDRLAQTAVLILSILEKPEDKVKAFKIGTDDYLTKPFDLAELNARIDALLCKKHGEDERRRYNAALETLQEIIREVSTVRDVSAMLEMIAEKATRLVHARRSLFLLIDPDSPKGLKAYGYNYSPEHLDSLSIDEFNAGLSGWVSVNKKPIKVKNAQADERQKGVAKHRAEQFNSGPIIVAPVVMQNEVIGTLTTVNELGDPEFTAYDLKLIRMLADQAAGALANAQLIQELDAARQQLDGLVQSSFDAVIAINNANKIMVYNARAEELFGYTAEEMLAQNVLVLHTDPENAFQIHKLVSEKGSIYNHPVTLRKKDGQIFKAYISAKQITNKQGLYIGQAGFIRDRQDTRLLENRLHALILAGQAINSALEVGQVLELVLKSALNAFPDAQRGSLHLYNDKTDLLELVIDNFPYSEEIVEALHFRSGEGIAGWVFAHRQARVYADACQDPQYKKIEVPGVPLHRAMICAPLQVNEQSIGVISLSTIDNPDVFKEEDINLLETFAAQAGIAIQKARQFERANQQIEEINLLREISARISAQTSIDQILDSLVVGGRQLLGVEMATAHILDEASGLYTTYAAPQEKKETLSQRPRHKGGLTAEIIRSGEPIIVADVELDQRVNPGVVKKGIRSFVGFPLKVGDKNIGALFLDSTRPRYFEQRQLDLITLLVAQTAVTIEVARTLSDTGKQADISAQMVQTSQELTQTYELEVQLDIIVRFLRDVLDAPMYFVAIHDERSDTLKFEVIHDKDTLQEKVSKSLSSKKNWGLAGYVVKSGKALIWSSCSEKQKEAEQAGIQSDIRGAPCESGLILPLEVGGKVFGAISIQSDRTNAWDQNARQIFRMLTSLVAVALRNGQLFKEKTIGQDRLRAALEASKDITTERDPQEALEVVVERVCTVSGAWRAFCVIVDEVGFISHQAMAGFGADSGSGEAPIRDNGISRQVINTGKPEYIHDTDRYGVKLNPKMVQQGVRAAACLPLTYKDQALGVLWLHYLEAHTFEISEQEALMLFANQAAIAYENARRMRELEYMRRAVEALSGAIGTQEVLEQIVKNARVVLGADSAAIWSYDDVRDKFIPDGCVAAGIPDEIWETFVKEEPRAGQTAYTVIKQGRINVENVGDTQRYAFLGKSTRKLLGMLGVKSFLGTALTDGDEILGILYVNYNQLRTFDSDVNEMTMTFANHAALALKKAKLLDQLETSRNAARVVARVSALGDLRSTMRSIVEGTYDALDCDAVTLYTYDEDNKEFGFPPEMVGVQKQANVLDFGFVAKNSILHRIINMDKLYVTDDTQNDPIMNGPFVQREGIRSTAGIQLIGRGKIVGIMFVNFRKRHRFTSGEIVNIELFAHQAAVAIDNAYMFEQQTILYDQQKRHLAALEALFKAGRAFSGTLNLDEILDHVAEQAYQLALPAGEHTHFSYVKWIEGGKIYQRTAYPRNKMDSVKKKMRVIDLEKDAPIGISGRVAVTGNAALVGDTSKNDDYLPFDESYLSQVAVPIKVNEEVVGVISVEHIDVDAFDLEDLRVLASLADQASLAIHNARQYEELRRTRGLVGARTALAWMGMASAVWRHSIVSQAQTIRDQIVLMAMDFNKIGFKSAVTEKRMKTIDRKATEILEKPITLPLSAEEGVERVFVNSFVKERLEQLWTNAPYQEIALTQEMGLDPAAVVAVSREWVRRALDVLIENASDAVSGCETKRIRVGTRAVEAGKCEIFVADNGPGIPEEIRDKITSDTIEKPDGAKGMGMGLLMAQIIVQTYGGEIILEYTGEEGTCMLMQLPLADH